MDLPQLLTKQLLMGSRSVGQYGIHPSLLASYFLGPEYPIAATRIPNQQLHATAGLFTHQRMPPIAQVDVNLNRHGSFLAEAKSERLSNVSDITTSSAEHDHRFLPACLTAILNSSNPDAPHGEKSSEKIYRPPEECGLLLYIPKDRKNLNQNQVYLRKQLEAFPATVDYLNSRTHGKSKSIKLKQVGIRCRHCSHISVIRRNKGSTYFPSNLMGIYQAAKNISVEHLQSGLCPGLPSDVQDRFARFAPRKLLSSGGGKKYWADAAGLLGLVDTSDGICIALDVNPIVECDQQKGNDELPSR